MGETQVDWIWAWIWVTPEYMGVDFGSIKLKPETRTYTRLYIKLSNCALKYI
jgi:hypothetical protein